ncbi:MAG: hypothetical protein IKC50_00290 [Oscillospiraceae bacterium]|nr:hypothetical protein [Oscillospiraceae bacterium]
MFNMRDFVMDTILGMVGEEPEYKVRQYALGWFDKGVLTEEDLTAIEAQLEAQRALAEEEETEGVEE